MVSLIQMEYILAVAKEKSFSKATETCFVTQPTLSMQISKVENELGIILFDRSKKPVILTEIGEKMTAQAKIILQEAKKLGDIVADDRAEISGKLSIGIIPTVAPYLLPIIVPKILNDYPNLHLMVEEITTDEILAKLQEDEIDLGILATPLNNKSVNEYPMYVERMLLYMSETHPLYLQEEVDINNVNPNEVWLLQKGHCFRNQVVNLCSRLKNMSDEHFVFESGSIETLIRMVDKYKGMTFIPEMAYLLLNEEQKRRIKPIRKENPGRQISIVTRRSYHKQKLIELLGEIVKENIPDEIKNTSANVISI